MDNAIVLRKKSHGQTRLVKLWRNEIVKSTNEILRHTARWRVQTGPAKF